MHKQHEDQPSNELPNLSTWHRVPVGATIPADTPFAYSYEDGVTVSDGLFEDITVRDVSNYTYYTEHPITPPLPTEEGATIAVSYDDRPPRVLLDLQDGRWITRYGDKFAVDQIHAWAPVAIGEVVVMP